MRVEAASVRHLLRWRPGRLPDRGDAERLGFLIGRRHYQPWGLIFTRQSVYDAGGGPVWYVRPDEYHLVRSVSMRVKSWLVRLEPGSSDWLEEREWRVPLSGDDAAEPALPLLPLHLAAVLVGDQNWSPARTGWTTSPTTAARYKGSSCLAS